MNVHGIYDTSATMHTFESRGEFQSYLQQEAGVSGSYFGFYAGAKKAWGSSVSAAQQQYMSVLDVDVDRWGNDHMRRRKCVPHNPSLFYVNWNNLVWTTLVVLTFWNSLAIPWLIRDDNQTSLTK